MQFLGIYWWFFLEVCWIVGLSCLWQAHIQLINLWSIIVDLPTTSHMDHAPSYKALYIVWLGIP